LERSVVFKGRFLDEMFVFVSRFRNSHFYVSPKLCTKGDWQMHEGGLREHAELLSGEQERREDRN
jgi:hypothetical protein